MKVLFSFLFEALSREQEIGYGGVTDMQSP